MTEVSKLNRLLASFIDSIIAYIPGGVLAFIAGATDMNFLINIGYALLLGYLLFKDALFGGQSIGKKVMKYKAVKEDGTSLAGDFVASAIRNVSLFIPIVNIIECVFVIIDKPRLSDGWAKTKVVKA